MAAEWPEETVLGLQSKGHILVEDGNHGESRPRRDEFVVDGTAFIRAADMEDGRVLFESASKISDIALSRIRKGIGAGGDVILSHKGTVGKVALAPLDAPPFVCSPQTTLWRTLDEHVLDRRYLHVYMRSRQFHDQLDSRKRETDMADYVSLTAQRDLKVKLPPIEEQRVIGNSIGSLDDKIDSNRRMNAVLEAMARAMFKAWFVDFETVKARAAGATSFPGMPQDVFDQLPDQLTESELGPVPEGWEVAAISGIADYVNGKAFTKHASEAGRMVVRIAELNSGPSGSTVYSSADTEPEYTAFPDDILFAWSGSLGVYRWHRDEAIVNQHIFKVIPLDRPKWYVYYRLVEAMPFFESIAATKATTMGHIKRGHLSDARFAEPPGWLVTAADEMIGPLFELIHVNERQSLTLAALRDTLLPKLISGELRIGGSE